MICTCEHKCVMCVSQGRDDFIWKVNMVKKKKKSTLIYKSELSEVTPDR